MIIARIQTGEKEGIKNVKEIVVLTIYAYLRVQNTQ